MLWEHKGVKNVNYIIIIIHKYISIYVVYQKLIHTNQRLVCTAVTAKSYTKTRLTSGTALSCTRGRSNFGTSTSVGTIIDYNR